MRKVKDPTVFTSFFFRRLPSCMVRGGKLTNKTRTLGLRPFREHVGPTNPERESDLQNAPSPRWPPRVQLSFALRCAFCVICSVFCVLSSVPCALCSVIRPLCYLLFALCPTLCTLTALLLGLRSSPCAPQPVLCVCALCYGLCALLSVFCAWCSVL